MTHRRTDDVAPALAALLESAARAGVELRFDAEETDRHGLAGGDGVVVNQPVGADVDVCIVLGGDGTILKALRAYRGTGVPIFAVNFGEVGFLATIEPGEVPDGFERAFAGTFEVLALPAIAISGPDGGHHAINDVSIHRRPGGRVAQLAYSVGADEVGRVRCDGLVIATPAGSTGYNLANGGPVLAWGVEGVVVSFIAPHSLTARALVVAPADVITVTNISVDESAEVSVDGRPVGELAPGESIQARFADDQGRLAQVPGATFYHRLREKFGRLAA